MPLFRSPFGIKANMQQPLKGSNGFQPYVHLCLRIFILICLLSLIPAQKAQLQSPLFVDVSHMAGIAATHRASWNEYSKKKEDFTDGYMAVGQAWGDYDNDGWVDLYVTGKLDENVLYHNNQDGTFRVSPYSKKLRIRRYLPSWPSMNNALWANGCVWNIINRMRPCLSREGKVMLST
jgi:hypothetical protein